MKLTLALLLLLLAAPALSQSPCSPGDAARAATLPLSLQYKLLAHKGATDDFELDAPADVSRDIVMLRKTLDIATQAFFHCEAGDDMSPASLQAKLATFLHTDRSKRDDSHGGEDGIYGANLKIHIEPAKEFANSIFVVLTFGIECGEDNLLFLYTRTNGIWTQRLHWYSDKYTKPSDAFGDFFVYTTAPGPNQQPVLAVAHGKPWCTSRFSGFEVDLLAPGQDMHSQKVLAHDEHGYSRGDTRPILKPYGEGVTLRLEANSRDLEGVFTYVGVFRYRTVDGTLDRLPVAINARDFVDSWLDESWEVAEAWGADRHDHLQTIHQRFAYSDPNKDVPVVHYGPVRACSSGGDRYQLELDLRHFVGRNEVALPSIYAQVRQNAGSFTMLDITDESDRTCTGPDIMRKH